MIGRIDLYQRSLHHTKMAKIERMDEFEYTTNRLIEDLTAKMNEVIEEENRASGRRLLTGPATAYIDVADNILVAYPGEELDADDADEFDVVILPDLFPFKEEYYKSIQEAIARAKKRVVFGFYGADRQDYVQLHRFLNVVTDQYSWFCDESERPTYVIDKTT